MADTQKSLTVEEQDELKELRKRFKAVFYAGEKIAYLEAQKLKRCYETTSLDRLRVFFAVYEVYDNDREDFMEVLKAFTYGRTRPQTYQRMRTFLYQVNNGIYDSDFFTLPIEWQAQIIGAKGYDHGNSSVL